MAIKTIQEVVHDILIERSEAALNRFKSAVRPIYGTNPSGTPDHIGSALLLHLSEGHFLLTAAHVIDHNDNTSLYLGAKDFITLQFEALITEAPGGDRNKDHADFAIAKFDPDFVSKLSGAKFVTEAEISCSVALAEGRAYTCLGYPNSKNKPNPYKGTKVTPFLGIYTSVGRPTAQLPEIATEYDHILVDHNPKYSRDENGNRVNSIALPGFSGGAIVDLGRISPETIENGFEPKLAALLIEGHKREKVILGTKLTTILNAIRKHDG